MEEPITFRSENYTLEGLLDQGSGQRAIVITHPHPLYGGSMHNNVVESIRQVHRDNGYTTLRFNFRGAGSSQGKYSDGQGEQVDVRAAVDFLTDIGQSVICLAGYSFGAWINALATRETVAVEHQIMISPPVDFIDFEGIDTIYGLTLVVTGSRDDIAPAKQIRKMMPAWNPAAAFEVLKGADHFYGGYTDALEKVLAEHVQPAMGMEKPT
jgi:alpha/beta superfamily hydrolase